MSLIPMLFSDWWEDLDHPHTLMDQHFGLPVDGEDLLNELEPLNTELVVYRPTKRRRRRYHPFLTHTARKGRGTSVVQADKNKFRVTLDVSQFQPDEVTVKVVDNNVIIDAEHEDKEDEHGWVSRKFTRKYMIPSQCDIEQVESHLSSDGILTITAPRKESQRSEKNEKIIKIQYTGMPAINESENANGSADGQTSMNQQPQQIQQQQQQQSPRMQQSSQQQQQQNQRGRKGGRA